MNFAHFVADKSDRTPESHKQYNELKVQLLPEKLQQVGNISI